MSGQKNRRVREKALAYYHHNKVLKRTTEPASQAMSGQTTPPKPPPYPSREALYKAAQRYREKFGTGPRSAQLIKHVVKTADSATQSELKKLHVRANTPKKPDSVHVDSATEGRPQTRKRLFKKPAKATKGKAQIIKEYKRAFNPFGH